MKTLLVDGDDNGTVGYNATGRLYWLNAVGVERFALGVTEESFLDYITRRMPHAKTIALVDKPTAK